MDAETKAYLEELLARVTAQVAALAGPVGPRSDARKTPGQHIGDGGSGMERELHESVRQLRADLGRLERRLDYLDQRLTGLDRRVTSVDDRITREAGWSRGWVSRIDRRITDLQHRIEEAEADGSAWGPFEPRLLPPMD